MAHRPIVFDAELIMILYASIVRWCVRLVPACSAVLLVVALACASAPQAGPLADGEAQHPVITAVDSSVPPRSAWIQMDQPGYAALFLVAPGHSATLLYPPDSLTSNKLTAGTHVLNVAVPELLVQRDTLRNADRAGYPRQRRDTLGRSAGRQPGDTLQPRGRTAISPTTATYLLLVTSPQPLVYSRLVEKTAGVSIPLLENEALNAVAMAVKSTIASEPRDWAAYYKRVAVRRK